MNNTTSTDPFPEALPEWLYGLSDETWMQEMAGLIAADLPRLTDEQRQVVYEDLIDLRLWIFREIRTAVAA